jgi:hypothetical protein
MTDTIACPACGARARLLFRGQCRACGEDDVVATIEDVLGEGDDE